MIFVIVMDSANGASNYAIKVFGDLKINMCQIQKRIQNLFLAS